MIIVLSQAVLHQSLEKAEKELSEQKEGESSSGKTTPLSRFIDSGIKLQQKQ